MSPCCCGITYWTYKNPSRAIIPIGIANTADITDVPIAPIVKNIIPPDTIPVTVYPTFLAVLSCITLSCFTNTALFFIYNNIPLINDIPIATPANTTDTAEPNITPVTNAKNPNVNPNVILELRTLFITEDTDFFKSANLPVWAAVVMFTLS